MSFLGRKEKVVKQRQILTKIVKTVLHFHVINKIIMLFKSLFLF